MSLTGIFRYIFRWMGIIGIEVRGLNQSDDEKSHGLEEVSIGLPGRSTGYPALPPTDPEK